MSLPAAASIMLAAKSQSTLLSQRPLSSNTSSRAVSRPILLKPTASTPISTSATVASTSTASVVPNTLPSDIQPTTSSSVAVFSIVHSLTEEPTSTAVILIRTTSTNTEQQIATQSIQPIISSLTSTSTKTTIEFSSSTSIQTTTVPQLSSSTSSLIIQTTTASSSSPDALVINGGIAVATTKSTTSSTNTASPIVAVTSTTGQTDQSSLAPVSTTPLPFATKAGGESPAQSSAGNVTTTTTPTMDVRPMMGGVIGGVAILSILLFLWWRIHKKKRSRQSVFSPTVAHFHRRNLSEKYEIDGESLGPTPRSTRWRAQTCGLCSRIRRNFMAILMAAKTGFIGEDASPSVNLNRGNSQFLEPLPQHSRSNSAANQVQDNSHVNNDVFGNRWNRFTEDVNFNWFRGKKSKETADPYADTQRIIEKDTYAGQASPQLPPTPSPRDLNLDQTTQPYRSPSLGTFPVLTLPELSFSAQPTIPDLSKPSPVVTLHPFANPTDPTSPFTSKQNTSKLADSSQQTFGLSQPMSTGLATSGQYMSTILMKATPTPRYPLPIRTNQINNCDSFVSPVSASDREIKGRSDPFDLERTEIRQPPVTGFTHNQNENVPVSPFSTKGIAQGMRLQPRTDTTQVAKHQRMVSDAPTYGSSKYSSGFSLLDQMGDSAATVDPLSWNKASPQDKKAIDSERNGNGVNFGGTVGMAL